MWQNEEELSENDFNNIQQNERFYDLIHYMKKILFWLRIIGIPFLIAMILIIINLIMLIMGAKTTIRF